MQLKKMLQKLPRKKDKKSPFFAVIQHEFNTKAGFVHFAENSKKP